MESGFSECALVAARRVLPVPCPAPEVVALLTSGLTASLALEEVGGLLLPGAAAGSSGSNARQQQQQQGSKAKQRTVLVTAAAGGTGQFAVQLAKLAGCHVVATCGGADKARLLQELGVDRVINYK
jgi:NADPH:quinone reductase-like Zn-dependent oxidoreductase